MKSIILLITIGTIGILAYNAIFINLNIANFKPPKEVSLDDLAYTNTSSYPFIQGVNQDISQVIIGAKGEFDNLYIKVNSENYLKVLDIRCNQKVINAADENESTKNINLVGLYFPVDNKKSALLNLKNLLNQNLQDKGYYSIDIAMSNQNDSNGQPIITVKKILVKVV